MTLDGLFAPRAVAVIGVGRSDDSVGRAVWRNLVSGDASRPVYAVNPKLTEVDGQPCFPSVGDVPRPVDLAVIAVPAAVTASVVTECGAAGIACAIVISAGFKETGPAGAALERDLARAARESHVRLLGPNCLGEVIANDSLAAAFSRSMPLPGGIAMLSQSGAVGTAILDTAVGSGLGVGAFVSLGNRADITEVDLMDAWREDDRIAVVAAYLESVADGDAFVRSASRLTARKPLVVLKAGRTDAGARAVSSHTGSLAGSDAAYDAAFAKCGAIRVGTLEELYDLAAVFASRSLPSGRGVTIVTNAGGPAILAADACESAGVSLSGLDTSTIDRLREVLPPAAALFNPVDVLGDADAVRYRHAMDIVIEDPDVRALIVVLTPQTPTQPVETAHEVVRVARESGLPMAACFMGGPSVADGRTVLIEGGVPSYEYPEDAVRAIAALETQLARLMAPEPRPAPVRADRAVVAAAVEHARRAGRLFITEESAARIAASYGLSVPDAHLARSLDEAREAAERIGYPVVLKIASPDILHKSDIGGIRLGIADTAELAGAWEAVVSRAHARMPEAVVWGAVVQETVPPGREVIIGMSRDTQFGPLVMFGLGGVYVEVLKDVAFRLCPVSLDEARAMMTEVRAFGLLRGARGEPPADLDAVAEAIVRVSALAVDFPEIVEMDINPLIVGERSGGAVAADVRIGIGG